MQVCVDDKTDGTMRHFITSFLIALTLLSVSGTAAAKIYLVAAGIADYPGTKDDLLLPAKDAQTIARVYADNSDTQYRLLLNREATVGNILDAMTQLFAKASAYDIVVFYFSGHGYQGGFCAYDGSLSYAKLRAAIAKSKARSKMIFADACFSGQMRASGRAAGSKVDAAKDANAMKSAKVMLFLSSRSDEMSMESLSMENGYFTSFLQKGLRGEADKNRDRIITARELYLYVKQGVVNVSRDMQHPVMWGKFPDNMTVMKW